ncbi:MAG: hypothetical protein ISR55_04815 [Bacteroidetes bacterium]|nr:hypothetical protein [Bacteroidota bacterium]
MKAALFSILLLHLSATLIIAQTTPESYEKCLLAYNEVNNNGIEEQVQTFGWFTELPYVPVYTYFDRDINRKVTIKTSVESYQSENLADLKCLKIVGGAYGMIMGKCKKDGKEFEILDLKKLHPDFIGLSLAVEIKLDPENELYIFESFPFEDDFPFKFEEDVVYTKILVKSLEEHCRN